jgi:prolipoprotein diacylglyceryltransferase
MFMHENPLGGISIFGGVIGSFIGLWAGYKAYQSFDV